MEYVYTRSGNVIAKDARVQGAQFVVNKGNSFIGHRTEVHGERNNGKAIISWGKNVILDDRAKLLPAERNATFYPLLIGEHVFIGKDSVIEAASIGSGVAIGCDCVVGKFAIIKDNVIIEAGTSVPPFAVVGPSTKLSSKGREELPESAHEAIVEYCELTIQGLAAPFPFNNTV